MNGEERDLTLPHHAKTRMYLVHIGFQHSRNCIRQYKYISRMDFNFKAQSEFDFHYFYCATPEGTVDGEMTIWMMDGIQTYRRDQTTQMNAYSPWGRQVGPFSSIHKKITDYEEEKRKSHKDKTLIPSPQ